ncbi:MAG: ParA family protein [Desulfonatronovibrionaceae bacterium]
MKCKVLAIANQKGGVGKTTTALSLGESFAAQGKKVLVMDLDPHACASIHMAFYPENMPATVRDIFAQKGDIVSEEVVIVPDKKRSFYFVPSHVRLSDVESDLRDISGKGLILRNWIQKQAGGFDAVIIDCPPHMGVVLINALVASDMVIIPIQTDFLALHGLKLIFETMRTLNRALSSPIEFRALATMHDRRAGACRRVLNLLRKKLGARLFETVIHVDTKFREASAMGMVISRYAPDSRGAREYDLLAREVLAL